MSVENRADASFMRTLLQFFEKRLKKSLLESSFRPKLAANRFDSIDSIHSTNQKHQKTTESSWGIIQ